MDGPLTGLVHHCKKMVTKYCDKLPDHRHQFPLLQFLPFLLEAVQEKLVVLCFVEVARLVVLCFVEVARLVVWQLRLAQLL
jgi:hypothetical protein